MELTKEEIDVIMCMLNDIELMYGLKPEELELKEKIERWFENTLAVL
jgi:hypothetical protein